MVDPPPRTPERASSRRRAARAAPPQQEAESEDEEEDEEEEKDAVRGGAGRRARRGRFGLRSLQALAGGLARSSSAEHQRAADQSDEDDGSDSDESDSEEGSARRRAPRRLLPALSPFGVPSLRREQQRRAEQASPIRERHARANGGAPPPPSPWRLSRRGRSSDAEAAINPDADLPPFDLGRVLQMSGASAKEEGLETRLRSSHLSIIVHRADELPHQRTISHPVVCVSIVDSRSGRLLRKSVPTRPGVTAHELQDYLLPVMTKPYKLGGAATRLPVWEEELVIAEEFARILHPKVLLFTELLDFAEGGWRPLAWGFLRPLGTAAAAAAGRLDEPADASAATPTPLPHALRPMPLRVQLFRWRSGAHAPAPGQADVWPQFLVPHPETYSSTIYLSIMPVAPPAPLTVKYPFRPMAAHHHEEGRYTAEELVASRFGAELGGAEGASLMGVGPQRRPGRGDAPCLLPNSVLFALPGGTSGATAVTFSPDGGHVAAAVLEGDVASVRVFDVGSGAQIREAALAHHRSVYELDWSSDGSRILSVSGDGTAKLWTLDLDPGSVGMEVLTHIATLSHPCYAYTGRFQKLVAPREGALAAKRASALKTASVGSSGRTLVVTGAADGAIRLWDGKTGTLISFKVEHNARVNAIVWGVDGAFCFSGDAEGIIKVWEVGSGELRCNQTLNKKELGGAPIDSLAVHPNKRRLLLQLRTGSLLALDTRLHHFAAKYTGHTTADYQIRARYSPDGRFVVAGGIHGSVFVWAEETGALLRDGWRVGLQGPLLQVAWSETEHIIACAAYGTSNPVMLCFYDPQLGEVEMSSAKQQKLLTG